MEKQKNLPELIEWLVENHSEQVLKGLIRNGVIVSPFPLGIEVYKKCVSLRKQKPKLKVYEIKGIVADELNISENYVNKIMPRRINVKKK